MDGAMTGMSSMMGNLDLADIGSGISAFSQIGGGIASFAQGKNNASMLRKLGVISAEEERVRTRRILGAQQAAAAASGIDPTSGSAMDVQGDTALEGEIAALMAKFDYDAQAAVVEGEATESLMAGFQNAASTILGTQLDKLGQNPRTKEGASEYFIDVDGSKKRFSYVPRPKGWVGPWPYDPDPSNRSNSALVSRRNR